MCNKIRLKIFLVASFCALISACVEESNPFVVPLSKTDGAQVQTVKNRNLKIVLRAKLPNSSGIGGDAYQPDLRFKNTKEWMKSRLAELNTVSCPIKSSVSLYVSIDKIYTWNQNDIVTGELVLSGKLYKNHNVYFVNYRGECEAGFLSSSSVYEINRCLNSAMDQILEKMKSDIC